MNNIVLDILYIVMYVMFNYAVLIVCFYKKEDKKCNLCILFHNNLGKKNYNGKKMIMK